MKKTNWEHRVVTIEYFFNNIVHIGADGWELVAVYNDEAYFKRPLQDGLLPNSRKEVSVLLNELSKRNDSTSQNAATFIRNTIGIANTIVNTGWHFESGSDLIEDILYPKFAEPKIK
jgi:hypothetical protein